MIILKYLALNFINVYIAGIRGNLTTKVLLVFQRLKARVHWVDLNKPMFTKPIVLMYVSLPFEVPQEKRLSGHGP